MPMHDQFGVRRVYETKKSGDGLTALRLKDCVIELGQGELSAYQKIAEWLPTQRPAAELQAEVGMDEARLGRFVARLAETGLLYRREDIPAVVSGPELHRVF